MSTPTIPDERPTNVRYLVLAALAGGAVLSYLLRVGISPAGTTVQRDLDISSVDMGEVMAAFFLGYFWLQIPGGWFGKRFGARLSLGVMGLTWVAAMVVMARAQSGAVLYWSRFALGVAQAGLFPVTIMAIRDWFPNERRGLASSTITACMSLGAVIANWATTRLMLITGWRDTFLIYAGITAAWSVWFLFWFRDQPGKHPSVNLAEFGLITGKTQDDPLAEQVEPEPAASSIATLPALGAMALSLPMWTLNAQAFFQAFGYGVFITWFPAYLEKGRGLSVKTSGDLTIWPLMAVVVGSFIGGYLIDRILKRTGWRWMSRSGMPALGLFASGGLIALASFATNSYLAVALIASGMLFAGIAMPGKWACTIDLTGPLSAIGFAVMNMSGNIGAWVCPRSSVGCSSRSRRAAATGTSFYI